MTKEEKTLDKNFIKFRAIIPYGKYFVKTGRAKFKKGRWEITTPTSWTASQREKILKYFTSEPSDFRSYEVSETSLKAFKENNSSISDIKRNFADRAEAIKRVSWLEFDEIDIDEFQHLLTDGIEQFSGKKSTEYMKAIKLFDFMKYIYKKKRPKKAKLVKIEYILD